MKRITSSALIGIIVLCCLNIEVNSSETINQPTHETIHSDSSCMMNASDNPLIHTIKNEGGNTNLINRLLPSSAKPPYNDIYSRKQFATIKNDLISDYITEYQYQIMHLEVSDIIHPFHYFW